LNPLFAQTIIGRLPLAELGLGFAESCALLATPGNPTDKEPTTAEARKSRRETVINPPQKASVGKRPPE
jgi:hypothetical protein